MTILLSISLLFQKWIEEFNEKIKKLNRHVLLIIDGASTHITDAVNLTNVKVLKLPSYTTSKL